MLVRPYPLYFSVISQDVVYTKWLLNNGYSPNHMSKNFIYTPLFYAVRSKNKKLIKVLLDHGADVNNINCYLRKTSIGLYNALDDISIVEMLLNYGADINLLDVDSGMSPLHEAVERNLYDVVKLLLSKGANINIRSSIVGYTPVHLAVKQGRLKILKLLLEYGADVNLRSLIYGYTPLHLAVKMETDNIEIINCIILYNSDIDIVDDYERTPLHYAVLKQDTTLIDLLIKNGANINYRNRSKRNILFSALLVLDVDFIIYLLELKGDINIVDISGETPFTMLLHRRFILSFIIKILVYHITMQHLNSKKIRNKIGHKINMKNINSISILKSYKEKAENDIRSMISFKLSHEYTLLDLYGYNKNNILRQFYNHYAIYTFEYYFPTYYYFIKKDIEKAIERNYLIRNMYELIDLILSNCDDTYWFKLPIETKYMILSNIDNDSMRTTLEKYGMP
ncbi:SWPV1-036 [Shearwaterpox virus]|uniref:SWPV1-036 n=1 Tax=Shearwaterpox virus TaxID=1974596 RepID=A0A1V0S7P7_CNPV|nr:SWPV1-036 [Shearwaterpox virus]